MNRKLTLTVELTVDHLNALAAMVELGAADRRDFLTRYSLENDWTDEQIAHGHYEADCAEDAVNRLTAAADNHLTTDRTETHSAPQQQTDEAEWAIYSPNEAATGTGGYWSINEGWVDEENATRFPACLVGTYSLPQSLGQDRQWTNLPLKNACTEEDLCNALEAFCKRENLPLKCAAELRADADLHAQKATYVWLDQFCCQWDAIVENAA